MRPAAWGRARTGRDGFTLLELIVVLALLVALGGLALPGLLSRVAGSTLDAVRTRIEAAAAICRAEAQRSGTAMELVSRETDGRTVVASRRLSDDETAPGVSEEMVLELPAGYSIVDARPGNPGGSEADLTPPETTLNGDEVREKTVVAVFHPDGTARMTGERFVVVGDAVLEIRVAPWTGAMSLGEPLPPEAAPAETEEDVSAPPAPESAEEDGP